MSERFEDCFNINDTPLNYRNEIPVKEVNIRELDRELFKRVIKSIDDEDKENIMKYGGYTVKDYIEGPVKYGTTSVSNSSFSEYAEIEVSLIVCWYTDEGKKELPLEFIIKDFYNDYSGGWN